MSQLKWFLTAIIPPFQIYWLWKVSRLLTKPEPQAKKVSEGKFEKGFNILMEYFDEIPVPQRAKISKQLKKLRLGIGD